MLIHKGMNGILILCSLEMAIVMTRDSKITFGRPSLHSWGRNCFLSHAVKEWNCLPDDIKKNVPLAAVILAFAFLGLDCFRDVLNFFFLFIELSTLNFIIISKNYTKTIYTTRV